MCCVQITSLFLHWFPACVAWTARWPPDIHAAQASQKSPEAMREWDTATVAQLILFPCLPYLLWAVLYYIKVTPASLKKLVHTKLEECLPYALWAPVYEYVTLA